MLQVDKMAATACMRRMHIQGTSTPLREIIVSLRAWPVWLYLSLNDIRSKYRRALLGPLWLVLGMGIAMSIMAVAWSIIFNVPWNEYIPYMIAGMLSWQLIAGYITGSCELFSGEFSGLVQGFPIPPLIHVFRFVMRGLFSYLHYIPFWLCIALISDAWPTWIGFACYLYGLILVLLTALGMATILGMLGARFRDISPAVSALMMPAMMLTPVMWKEEMLGHFKFIATYNPLTHYLEVIRAPLLGLQPASSSLIAVTLITVLTLILGLYTYRRFRHSLVYWT